MTRNSPKTFLLCIMPMLCGILLWQGCAHYRPLPQEPQLTVYEMPQSVDKMPAERWAPVFVAHGYADPFNRIGRPVVQNRGNGGNLVRVDPAHPTVYFMQRTFWTSTASYTNLIYRIHFPEVPYSMIPFNLTAGKNVGLFVVVTLNSNRQPVLVTTVHSCGCYLAIQPTNYLPRHALPENWTGLPQSVYGEKLPPLVDYQGIKAPRLLIHLRPEVHRVMAVEVLSQQQLDGARFNTISMAVEPISRLTALPAPGGQTSFYYENGILKGHVKASVKPWETMLLSLPSMDLFVGSDKIYADSQIWGNPFYTSLKPWRREVSDMWHFDRFLRYWGWRL